MLILRTDPETFHRPTRGILSWLYDGGDEGILIIPPDIMDPGEFEAALLDALTRPLPPE